MRKLLILAYGILAYAVGMLSLVIMMGWLGNLLVPRSIDSIPTVSLWYAMLVNLTVFVLFCMQHSVMARPKFKAWWTKVIPESAERSTYVLFSGIALFLVMFCWQPMGGQIWEIDSPVGRVCLVILYVMGWAILVGSTFALNHFDLFGLRQVWLQFRSQPYVHLSFETPGPYRMVRHPLYVGWLMLAWATPTMTAAHFVFAVATTAYILMAIRWEERDLVDVHGQQYEDYRRQTPMLIPKLGVARLETPAEASQTVQ